MKLEQRAEEQSNEITKTLTIDTVIGTSGRAPARESQSELSSVSNLQSQSSFDWQVDKANAGFAGCMKGRVGWMQAE